MIYTPVRGPHHPKVPKKNEGIAIEGKRNLAKGEPVLRPYPGKGMIPTSRKVTGKQVATGGYYNVILSPSGQVNNRKLEISACQNNTFLLRF